MNDDLTVHDNAAELALLAACLWSKTARQAARQHITAGDFYNPLHEKLWDAMGSLDREGRNVDPVTLQAHVGPSVPMQALMLEVTTAVGVADSAADYAGIIRAWSIRRRLRAAGQRLVQQATDHSTPPGHLASAAVRVLTGIRDHGAGDDVSALTLTELLDVPDDGSRWVIPELLEVGDRMMLTGTEGIGKSSLSRQIGVMAAAGLHPFTNGVMPPIRAAFIDCENKPPQVRRQVAPLLRWLADNGAQDPGPRVMFDFPGRIDLTRDRDLGAIHRMMDACQPELLVIGPLYRMTGKSLNDEENAAQMLVALDTIMDRGVALIIEAHAGHAQEGTDKRGARRALRPRGSSSLLGWPEFGLGIRALPHGLADLEPWRGGREQRAWPCRMRRAAGNRWVETRPDDRGDPPSPFDDVPPPADPQGDLLG